LSNFCQKALYNGSSIEYNFALCLQENLYVRSDKSKKHMLSGDEKDKSAAKVDFKYDFTALTDSAANQRMQLEAELQNQPSKLQQSSMIQRPDAAEKTI